MRLRLDIETCKKLLAVFTKHDRTSCTDQSRSNQYSNSEGWVSCTRCWLLQAVEDNYVPEAEFELYSNIKLPKKDSAVVLGEYVDLVNKYGIDHPACTQFLEHQQNNKEFIDLAKVVRSLRKKIDEERNKK